MLCVYAFCYSVAQSNWKYSVGWVFMYNITSLNISCNLRCVKEFGFLLVHWHQFEFWIPFLIRLFWSLSQRNILLNFFFVCGKYFWILIKKSLHGCRVLSLIRYRRYNFIFLMLIYLSLRAYSDWNGFNKYSAKSAGLDYFKIHLPRFIFIYSDW